MEYQPRGSWVSLNGGLGGRRLVQKEPRFLIHKCDLWMLREMVWIWEAGMAEVGGTEREGFANVLGDLLQGRHQ